MPAGISGVARSREWDATAGVTLPELEAEPLAELELRALEDGTLHLDTDARVAPGVLETLARELDRALERPYAARAVRQDARTWLVGARRLNAALVRLPASLRAESLDVTLSPDGERLALVDGEVVTGFVDRDLDAALAELEGRARLRFQAFAARADRLDDERWQLTVDPL